MYVRAAGLSDGQGEVAVSRQLLAILLESPAYSEIEQVTRQLSKQGYLAGELVLYMFVMERYRDKLPRNARGGPSLNKAIHIAMQPGGVFGDGDAFPRSERSLLMAWRQFRDVAHFWAAIRWLKLWDSDFSADPASRESFIKHVWTAQYFLRFGQDLALRNDSKTSAATLLSLETAWWAPDEFSARAPLPTVDDLVVSDRFLDALRRYAAPKKKVG